jgi:hypothetical protein
VSLVLIECSIRDELVHENPLDSDDVGAMGLGNKFSCPIAQQGPVLLLHSHMPIWIAKGSMDRGQNAER